MSSMLFGKSKEDAKILASIIYEKSTMRFKYYNIR